MKEKIRIAAGQGFWGDLPDAPVRQVQGGPIDYLMLDYLAEVTMSIMQKQKARDPAAGYARDFVPLMKEILPTCVDRHIKVIAKAGGGNHRRPHYRMRRAVLRRQLPVRVANDSGSRERRIPDRGSFAQWHFRHHQARRYWRPSERALDQRTTTLRDGRSARIYHAG